MARSGLRPHTWKHQGEIPHKQHIAWMRAKAQAHYRNEEWSLTLEEFQEVWLGRWTRRGRGTNDYVMSRMDPERGWHMDNVACIERIEYLKRQREYKGQ